MTRPAARVRAPAVAGRFYPGDARALARRGRRAARGAPPPRPCDRVAPKAIVVPHAGYAFSGPIAATAYATARAGTRRRSGGWSCSGPRTASRSTASPRRAADVLRTPLGDVPVDVEAARASSPRSPASSIDDAPHAGEHSLEVHLPFLQRTLADVHGAARSSSASRPPRTVAAVLDAVWGGPETLIVVSSDLSHYEPHDHATAHDIRTVDAILAGRIDAIGARRRVRRVPAARAAARGRPPRPPTRAARPAHVGRHRRPARSRRRLRRDRVRRGRGVTDALVSLPTIAVDAIAHTLRTGRRRLPARGRPPPGARRPGAAFVTLERGETLLGCIGTLTAERAARDQRRPQRDRGRVRRSAPPGRRRRTTSR